MARTTIAKFCFASLSVFLPILVAGTDVLTPIITPLLDEVCNKVECGKGTCNPTTNSASLFECQCDPGWKQTTFAFANGLKFLPCIVPNCSLDYSCKAAPAPVQDKSSRVNESILDPCFWTDCGGGSCNRTSQYGYNCLCREDYYNLLNISSFPCLRECSIGMDCKSLGIPISNSSTSPTPTAPNNIGNGEPAHLKTTNSVARGNIPWLIILGTSLAVFQ